MRRPTSNEGPESWSVYLVSLVWIWTDLRCSVYVTQLEGNGPVEQAGVQDAMISDFHGLGTDLTSYPYSMKYLTSLSNLFHKNFHRLLTKV